MKLTRTTELKLNDKVFSTRNGNGIVVEPDKELTTKAKHLFKVSFENGEGDYYTSDGKLYIDDEFSELFEGHFEINSLSGEPLVISDSNDVDSEPIIDETKE